MGCGAYVCKHAVDDGIGGWEQAHGVAFGGTQPRSFFGNFTDAGKVAVEAVHFAGTFGACRAETRLADKDVGDGSEYREKEEDNQPGKGWADVFLFVQHAQHAGECGAGVGEDENFGPGDVF